MNGIEDRNYKDNNNKGAIGDMLIEWKMSSRVSIFFNSIVRRSAINVAFFFYLNLPSK